MRRLLYDDLLSAKVAAPILSASGNRVPVIVADEVARATSTKVCPAVGEYEGLMPPYRECWVEGSYEGNTELTHVHGAPGACGWMVRRYRPAEVMADVRHPRAMEVLRGVVDALDGAAWVVRTTLYAKGHPSNAVRMIGLAWTPINELGQAFIHPHKPTALGAGGKDVPNYAWIAAATHPLDTEEERVRFQQQMQFCGHTLWHTLALLNTVNVRLLAQPARPLLPKQARRGDTSTRYHVLRVYPARAIRADGTLLHPELGAPLNPSAMHSVRGHFVRYTPERPLFGRYSGVWWREDHVRGNREHGVVEKTYEVKGVAP